jgi:hypothetical protein
MAATSSFSNRRDDFITKLKADFPQFSFQPGKQDVWSAKTSTISYNLEQPFRDFSWSVLHELAHALLAHKGYKTDFELVRLESEAWHKASELGSGYGVKIDPDHIQNCLDTYRDWLHKRSSCPKCSMRAPQQNATTYTCLNCKTSWHVSHHLARPYRVVSSHQ